MARAHGKILASIWRDPDWLARTAAAQRLYMLLLSQPRLTLVGSLDLTPGRWALLATDVSEADLRAVLAELEQSRFVVIDVGTTELLIRTFVAYDLDPNRVNKNLAKGLWGSWEGIASPVLRSVAVHEMPDALWEKLEPHAPADALQTRRSARLEPEPHPPSEPGSESPFEPPFALRPSPFTSHPPPTGIAVPVEPAAATTADERQGRLAAAAKIIGDRVATRPGTRDPAAMSRAVANGVRADRHADAYSAIAADPTISPEALAELLEPPPAPVPIALNPSSRLPLVEDVMPHGEANWEEGARAVAGLRQQLGIPRRPASDGADRCM